MSIPVDTWCLQCLLNRNLELVRPLGSDEKAHEFAKKLLRLYLDAPSDIPSPWLGPALSDLLLEMYGLPIDRYQKEKEESNRFVMERMAHIRSMVQSAPDPVFAGLQFSILGNYLDFAALRNEVSFEKLDDMLVSALQMPLDRQVYDNLCRDLANGKKLLYLTDNAGEIGFDRIFAEEIAARYPHLDITFCVRGAITSNDATREDAAAVGIPFPVIDNGTRIAGTILEQLGSDARTALEESDVVIAKGMANVETMWGCPYNVYYAFLVKCPKFVAYFNRPKLTPLLVQHRPKEALQ
jgi:uncharacterized protein with ATP-grasp and redox domains